MKMKYLLLPVFFILPSPSALWAQACALNVPSGTVTLTSGTYSYCSLSVSAGATLVIVGQVFLNVSGIVDLEGTVTGLGNGYPPGGSDPGDGGGFAPPLVVGEGGAGGGGHGGAGGNGSSGPLDAGAAGGVTTDSFTQPTMEGGGGGDDFTIDGGAGGAAFILVAGGSVTLNGLVDMDGAAATAAGGGGGAGGTISIDGAGVYGSGTLSVLGGGGLGAGGSGGGGRIRLCDAGGLPVNFTGMVEAAPAFVVLFGGGRSGTYYACGPYTPTPSPTTTSSPTASQTPTATATGSSTPAPTSTSTPTPTVTRTATPSPAFTSTATFTATVTATPTGTALPPCQDSLFVSRNLYRPRTGQPQLFVQASLCGTGPCSVKIYNTAGEQIRTLIETSSQPPGPVQVNWDEKNKYGDLVASGVYILVFQFSNGVHVAKVAVLR
jgi:hypothetical protein